MSAAEYLVTLVRLRLSKAAAARLLGISERTSRRYADGDRPIPPAHALLLRSFLVHNERPFVPKCSRNKITTKRG